MDRIIVYPGSIPLDTDLLNTNRNVMMALGTLMQAVLGGTTIVDGLAVSPTSPPSMNLQVGPGSISVTTSLDASAYGTLGSDTTDILVKMGGNVSPTLLAVSPPAPAGTSIAYLIEAAYFEADVNSTILPYYDPANPAVPWLGQAGSGVAQPTVRAQRVALKAKPGNTAVTGSQTAPGPDPGWVGIAVVTVTAGASTITAQSITPLASAPTIPFKLPDLRPGYASAQAFSSSGVFTVPTGVSRARITAIGGGGAGGLHQTLSSGGGGAGGRATLYATGLVPGSQFPVTVGNGGAPPLGGNFGPGGAGGTSSFGTLASATGGQGGLGGTVPASSAGGSGGQGIGGSINRAGSWGTDSIMATGRGGDGGGPGNGRGSSLLAPGIDAPSYGGGGGGGGASLGSNPQGATGGSGGGGLVIVEY